MAKKGSQLTVRTATEIQGGEFVILGYAGKSYQMTLDELKKFIGIIEEGGGSVDLTQVSTDILPLADVSKDIGSLEKRWKKVYSTALTVKAQSVDEEEVNIHDGGIEGKIGQDIQWSIDGSGKANFYELTVNGADVATMQYVNNELSKYVTTDTLTKNYVSNSSLTEILKKYYESGYVDFLLSSKASTGDLNKTNTQLGIVQTDVATLKSYFQDTDDVDDIINKWRELEAFLAGQTETSTLADLLTLKADKSTVVAINGRVTDLEDSDFVDIDSLRTALEDYYTKEEVNGLLGEAGGVDLAGYVNEIAASGTGNGIASVSKDGSKLTFTKATFLTSQSLDGYIKNNGSADALSITSINTTTIRTQGDYIRQSGSSEVWKLSTYGSGNNPIFSKPLYVQEGTSYNLLATQSWANSNFHPLTTVDTAPTISSSNLVTSGGVAKAVADLAESADGLYQRKGSYLTASSSLSSAKLDKNTITIAGTSIALGGSMTQNQLISLAGVAAVDAKFANYLPLAGGTLTGSIAISASGTLFALKNNSGNIPYMNFRSSIDGVNTDLGDLGVDPTDKNLKYYNKGAWNTLIHSGNIGSQSVAKANALVSSDGAVVFQGNEFKNSIAHYVGAVGGDATGLIYRTSSRTTLCGIGAYINNEVLQGMYMGWGDSPWRTANNFSVSEESITYKGHDIIHSGNIGSYAVTSDTLNDFPRLTGTSPSGAAATGTWGINISGSAALVMVNYLYNRDEYMPILMTGRDSIGTAINNYVATDFLGQLTYNPKQNILKAGTFEGNATSATKLSTARTIWGRSFDGTGNVSGNITLGAASIRGYDNRNILESTANDLMIGYGYATSSLKTTIFGNTIKLNDAVLINSSGNVTIGSSDLAGTSAKLYVDGNIRMLGEAMSLVGDTSGENTNADSPKLWLGAFGYSLDFVTGSYIQALKDGGYGNHTLSFFTKYSSDYATDPVERMRITASGNVGIGTTNPQAKLDVSGDIYSSGLYLNIGARIDAYESTRTEIALINTNDAPSMLELGNSSVRKWGIEARGSERNCDFSIYNWSSQEHQFVISSSNGNVGIGTTNPQYKLDVNGAGSFVGSVQIYVADTKKQLTFNNYSNMGRIYVYDETTSTYDDLSLGRNDETTFIIKGTTGDVGIGTKNPNTKLHVVGGAKIEGALSTVGGGLTIDTSNSDIAITHYKGTTKLWTMGNYNGCANFSDALYVQSGSTPIRVATVNDLSSYLPKAGGKISGSLTFSATSGSHIIGNSTQGISFKTTSGSDTTLYFEQQSANSYSIRSDDEAAYWNLGDDLNRFNVLYCRSVSQSSDATLKNILGNIGLNTSQIANAPAVHFTWKNGGAKDVGTIAQYWKDVLPEVVSGEEGSYGMNYAVLGVVSSIILARNIETHEQRIARLEKEISDLQKELNALVNNE